MTYVGKRRPVRQWDSVQLESRSRPFDLLFPLLLAGYLFFDKAFAWLHIPGTPAFVGEIVLVFGLGGAIRMMTWSPAWQSSSTPFAMALYAGWGLIRLLPGIFDDPIFALRDASIFLYVLVSLAVLAVLVERPHMLPRWLRSYRAIMPLVVIWMPIGLVVRSLEWGTVPDSNVPLTSVAAGGYSQVHLLMIISFIWLVWTPETAEQVRWRNLVSGGALVGILVLATANRGGFVAAAVGSGVFLALLPGRTRLIVTFSRVLLVVAVATVIIDPRIDLGRREISVEQLTENVSTLVGQQASSELSGNITWRIRHWENIWRGVNLDVPLAGHGFGPNIAEIYDIPQTEIGLRNAHNSQLTVFARMGWIGLVLWNFMWVIWFYEVNATRRRLRSVGLDRLSGLGAWAMVGAVGSQVEAFFNPTIEAPPGSFWLWSIFGLGLFLIIASRSRRPVSPTRRGGASSRDTRFDIEGIEASLAEI